jgi:hypothetical protein
MPTNAKKIRREHRSPKTPPGARELRPLTARDLGWTRERTKEVRAKLSAFAKDWDDPRMDVYNDA